MYKKIPQTVGVDMARNDVAHAYICHLDRLTGVRLRETPMTAERVKRALA